MLLLAGVSGVAVSSQVVQDGAQWYRAQFAAVAAQVLPAAPPPSASSLQYTIDQWKRLQQSDRWPFSDYANFLIDHQGWPDADKLRARRKASLGSTASTAARPPLFSSLSAADRQQGASALREALALNASGRRD